MISEVMSYEVEAKNQEEFNMLKEGRDSAWKTPVTNSLKN